MVYWWCTGGALVVYWWCTGGALVEKGAALKERDVVQQDRCNWWQHGCAKKPDLVPEAGGREHSLHIMRKNQYSKKSAQLTNLEWIFLFLVKENTVALFKFKKYVVSHPNCTENSLDESKFVSFWAPFLFVKYKCSLSCVRLRV